MTDVDYHAIARELSRTEDLSWLSDWLPYAPPPGWRLAAVAEDGRAYRSDDGLVAVMSGSTEQDGRRWIHLSVSRKDRLPSWDDLVRVRDAFLGPEVEAYQVIPPRSRSCEHLSDGATSSGPAWTGPRSPTSREGRDRCEGG
ncbi:MAG: hypothetical protein KatS3mg082_1419 [Nitrospiraceae bacterium]|nr:MAG: hypothetical protein KatS3mg082_1419 [Nitrospiraceae bacterium]